MNRNVSQVDTATLVHKAMDNLFNQVREPNSIEQVTSINIRLMRIEGRKHVVASARLTLRVFAEVSEPREDDAKDKYEQPPYKI